MAPIYTDKINRIMLISSVQVMECPNTYLETTWMNSSVIMTPMQSMDSKYSRLLNIQNSFFFTVSLLMRAVPRLSHDSYGLV